MILGNKGNELVQWEWNELKKDDNGVYILRSLNKDLIHGELMTLLTKRQKGSSLFLPRNTKNPQFLVLDSPSACGVLLAMSPVSYGLYE